MRIIQINEEDYQVLLKMNRKLNKYPPEQIVLDVSDCISLNGILRNIDFGDNPETMYDFLGDDQIDVLFKEATNQQDMGLGEDEIDRLMKQWEE